VSDVVGGDIEFRQRVEYEVVVPPGAGVDDRRLRGVDDVHRPVVRDPVDPDVDVVNTARRVDRVQLPDYHTREPPGGEKNVPSRAPCGWALPSHRSTGHSGARSPPVTPDSGSFDRRLRT